MAIDVPNISVDRKGQDQRARHVRKLKEDPSYQQRWRITNALAKDKARAAAGERRPVTLARVMFLERPEID
jgi:hypothetical protein